MPARRETTRPSRGGGPGAGKLLLLQVVQETLDLAGLGAVRLDLQAFLEGGDRLGRLAQADIGHAKLIKAVHVLRIDFGRALVVFERVLVLIQVGIGRPDIIEDGGVLDLFELDLAVPLQGLVRLVAVGVGVADAQGGGNVGRLSLARFCHTDADKRIL